MGDDSRIEYSEELRQGRLPDGTEAAEDVVTATDTESGEELVDDLVATASPDGSVTVEETVSAVDSETGAAEILSDTTEKIDPA